ncbi:hypothetical protein ACFPN1_08835 [Lysobacter yangpyeongensis]|uniref:Bulb-type lectin domain-containing protein n=1 Tax=Lysobacter yangpyeongensis TaxID=346182 RepID=A0ABW0SNB1_9GAMM
MNLVVEEQERPRTNVASPEGPTTDPRVFATVPLGDQIAADGGNILPGTDMLPTQWAASANDGYVLILQTDGNLVLYQVVGVPPRAGASITGSPLWASSTTDGAKFSIQTDGNLVLYNAAGDVSWSSNTWDDPQSLRLQDDGDLIAYDTDGTAQWSSFTSHLQVWPPPRWVYVQNTVQQGSDGTPCVLTVGDDGVTLAPRVPGSPTQLWQITPDGRLVSGLINGSVLSQSGTAAISAAQDLPASDQQTWLWSNALGPTAIRNDASNGYLCAASDGSSVMVGDSDTPAQWYFLSSSPLDAIMAMPPSNPSFPAFTAEGDAVYAAINTQLAQHFRQPDLVLRDEYANLSADIDGYRQQLPKLDYSAFPDDVWKPVADQLEAELDAAISVRNVFQLYGDFHEKLFEDNGFLLNKLGQLAGFEQGDQTSVGGLILAIVSGVIYTVLSDMGGAYGVAANVLQSGINAAVAAQKSDMSPSLFQVAYADLWTQLSGTFEALLATFDDMQQAMLTDWAKMSAVSSLTTSKSPDSLAWPAGKDSHLLDVAANGYTIAVMQMLLPARFQIYQYVDDNDDPIDKVPQYAQHITPYKDGYYKYWIADPVYQYVCPDEAALDAVWAAGATQDDFFAGSNGWAFAKTMPNTFGGNDANHLIIALTNLGPNPVVVVSQGLSALVKPDKVTIPGYRTALIQCTAIPIEDIRVGVQVFDPSRGFNADQPVGQFVVHQNYSVAKGGEITIESISSAGNYQLSTPLCNRGAYNSYPGAVQVSIFAQ